MKKVVLVLLVSLFCNAIYGQKKKTPSKKSNAIWLGSSGAISAEISKTKFYLCINKKDTITIKPANFDIMPMNCKITPFTAKNTPLHLVTWTETVTTTVPNKITVSTVSNSKVYDMATKTEVLTNTQTITNIKEQVQLGKTAASETQERNRTEGSELVLLPTGDLVLKSKKAEKKYSYDVASKSFK